MDESEISVESVDGTSGDSSGSGASSSGLSGDGSSSSSSLDGGLSGADADLLNRRVIYFEYDSSSLTLESEAIVQAHAHIFKCKLWRYYYSGRTCRRTRKPVSTIWH